ncbi:MAG: hypothetical protein SGPRY_006967 [Prymnesium sp.]
MSHEMQPARKLNRRAVFAICLANCAHFYSIASIFSYAGFLAVDLGWAPDEDSAGFVAGLLPTILMLGRMPTSILWGVLADRIGRRPTLAISMASVALGNLFFGLSTSLVGALVARFFFLGCGNGYVSLMGMLSLEVGGEERQSEIFSWVLSAGSVIAMVGPALGGYTYGTLSSTYPALAPSLIGCALAFICVVVVLVWLPETRPTRHVSPRRKSVSQATVLRGDVPMSHIDPDTTEAKEGSGGGRSQAEEGAGTNIVIGGGTIIETGEGIIVDGSGPIASRSLRSILFAWPMPMALLLRTGHGMALFGIFDVVPLWCIASLRAGGLAFSEDQVGTVLAAAAAGQLVFTSLVMGRLVNFLGQRQALVWGCAIAGAALWALPFVGLVQSEPRVAIMSVLASLIYCVHTMAMLTAGTGSSARAVACSV